ncbi:PPOX class F420-dependent oxidoreductase [Streptomyces sp. B-S-A8]|uniref:PPOX class F420-dependent oxidoreductase n=1 Tax=Streptomyces solicavernae TaxID=3043614 RepID=A0ABT6RZV0_9ACTN|nr:PPOX class F420-dependent oxidoreductase [Streptomyces sp. B-S-A8]MDI3389971.1 PPOX class F420-dependent oxidoreductase [Streptomyces sp. B-S-A8]
MPVSLPEPVKKLLDSPVFGTVATLQPDGSPQLTVVWVTADGDQILFVTSYGTRKEKNLRRDPRTTVLINPSDAPYSYASISGLAEFTDENAAKLLDELSVKYSGKVYAEFSPGNVPEADQLVVVRVTPTRVAGNIR